MKLLRILLLATLAACSAVARQLDISVLPQPVQNQLVSKFPSIETKKQSLAEIDQILSYLIGLDYDFAEVVQTDSNTYLLKVSKAKKIGRLLVSGTQKVSEFEVRRELNAKEGTVFDQEQLIQSATNVQQYYEARGFHNAQVEVEYQNLTADTVEVRINVKEGKQITIDQVSFQSANPEILASLKRTARRAEGSAYTSLRVAELSHDLRTILSEDAFYRAELSDPKIEVLEAGTAVKLVFQVSKPEKYYLYTQGTERLSHSEVIESLNLDEFHSANPSIAPELAARIKAYYMSRGYARVDVRTEEKESSNPFERRITFIINEGPRVEIEQISLSGRYSQSQEFYVDFIKDNSSSLIRRGFYVKEDLERGIENLVTDRRNKGFVTAKVSSLRTVYNKQKSKVSITINFDEGPLTRVQSISFEGNKSFNDIQLIDVLGMAPNQPLSLAELEKSIASMKQFYREAGFLDMSIANEREVLSYNEDNSLAKLLFRINEGPKVRVARILVEGNSLTKESVIMKELEFEEGEVLTPEKIDESVSRLQRVGYFSSVEIRTLEEGTQVQDRTVLVRVQDRDPGLFEAGFGATNERNLTLRGYTGVAYRNINGTGRQASARIDANYNVNGIRYFENTITLGYLEPYLFNSRTRARLNLSRAMKVTDYDLRRASEIRNTTLSLEQDLTSNVFLSWDVINFTRYRDFYFEDEPVNTNRCTDCATDIGSTGPTLDIDFRDHPFNPSTGSFTQLRLEYGSPFWGSNSNIEYLRAQASFTLYSRLASSWVWANSIRGGYLRNLNPSEDGAVPYDKKGFVLGGQTTIRGFQPDDAFPSLSEQGAFAILMTNASKAGFDYPLNTAASMGLFKSELRFPIYGVFGGALFYDGGLISIDKLRRQEAKPDQTPPTPDTMFNGMYRDALGLALRIITPVGALSFEYGRKLRPQNARNENVDALHISMGTF